MRPLEHRRRHVHTPRYAVGYRIGDARRLPRDQSPVGSLPKKMGALPTCSWGASGTAERAALAPLHVSLLFRLWPLNEQTARLRNLRGNACGVAATAICFVPAIMSA
jgi:hypothetical protein